MSLLRQRLRQMESQADPRRRAERESHNLAGDGLEMAARTALEAWQQRPRHPDESDVFRLGYRLACHELALVFRATRKGEPPSKAEFDELRRLVFEDAAGEKVPGQFEDLNRYLPPAEEQVREAIERTKELERVSQRKFNGEHGEDLHEMLVSLSERQAVRRAAEVYEANWTGDGELAAATNKALNGLISRFPGYDDERSW